MVSVVIVNWNCRDLLRNCLQSLLRQDQGVRVEVIVVDNASTDGASSMVARKFPQVRLIENDKNIGFARANNKGARLARGHYLFFLNNDTVLPSLALAKLMAYLDEHPEVVLLGPCLLDANGKRQLSWRQRPTPGTFLHRTLLLRWTGLWRGRYRAYRRETHVDSPRPVEVLMGAALMMRRHEFWRLGGWDEDFTFGGEDMELCYRANQHGRVVYLPTVEITHLGRTSTRQNIGFASPNIAAGFAKYFRKSGASWLTLLLYKAAITLDAPLQLLVKGCQFLVRRVLGRQAQAEQSLNVCRGAAAFLWRGLPGFWRS